MLRAYIVNKGGIMVLIEIIMIYWRKIRKCKEKEQFITGKIQFNIHLLLMNKIKGTQAKKNDSNLTKDLSDTNNSLVVLQYIQPARQLLQSSTITNSVYQKQLNALPYIFKCSDQLHPLANNLNQSQFVYEPDRLKIIYKRDTSLKINPFQTSKYFKSVIPNAKPVLKSLSPSFEFGQLFFDSNFESGNLLSAHRQLIEPKYHLMMQNDISTYGCTQWFFFRVFNRNPSKATFFINNFYKPNSLYKKGMKVLIFSMKRFINEEIGWVRGGEQICYFPNQISQKKGKNGPSKSFFSLKFCYNFQYANDEVYFAYNYPYTYSKLTSYLAEKKQQKNPYYNCRTLCKTIAQNKIFLLTITDSFISKQKKKSIFLTSRVHPGQTVSSLMIQGIINFLTSDHELAKELRQKFIFKIIPMLNPDGVIHGNYRTNLAGIDLNRVWDAADRTLSPEIYELKKHILQFNKECPVIMFCDLHGHSIKKSAFIYGCKNEKTKLVEIDQESRLFPYMLSETNEDFRYQSCNFRIDKSKKGTARIQLWKQLKIPNIFTLEASFCSSQNSSYHFRPGDYSEIGISFCKTIHQYFLNPEKKTEFYQKFKDIKDTLQIKYSDDDSDSDQDLFDKKQLNELCNGVSIDNFINDRKIVVNKRPLTNTPVEQKTQQTQPIKRRLTIDKPRRLNKTETSPQVRPAIISISSKKTVTPSIATKRLTLNTEVSSEIDPKGYLKRSIFNRMEHNYRGKSTIYRIKKGTKKICQNNFKQHQSVFYMEEINFLERKNWQRNI